MDKKVYYEAAINQIPRILGQLDRNRNSKTYGCFDRNYWHYKIIDFPCARHQEAALTLALLYKLKQKDNPYFSNNNVLRWVNASLRFWCSIQNKDGSFNEWYPNERSFVATAFSSYAISETLISLNKDIAEKDLVIRSLRKSGNWLSKHNEWEATNQVSGAVISLFNIYFLTKDKRYLKACQDKLKELIGRQNPEGWWNEYNGPDIGYLSLTVDYLSKFFKKYPDKKLKNSINKAIEFLSYFMHPNMTFGGEYGSRNTEYIIPGGIEISTRHNKNAVGIASAVRESLKNSVTIAPYSFDDRYLCYIAYTWLQAYLESKNELKPPKYKFDNRFKKDFTNAKILIVSNNSFYIIINYSKGGAFSLYLKKGGYSINDSGIIAVDKKNNYLTSSRIACNNIEKNGSFIGIKGNLWKIKNTPMSPIKNISSRIFVKTLGMSLKLSSSVKNVLRKKLITGAKKFDSRFTRQITISNSSIKIADLLVSKNKIKDVFLGEKHSNIYIPSSRYFQLQELNNKPLEFTDINKNSFKVERVLSCGKKSGFKVHTSLC
ncbi:hypothetical protein KY347_06520 [Candidatus Woesearchaeota archaeon]|nr:hypothetical protein [Candidatus Woesearchaeota archaeon]